MGRLLHNVESRESARSANGSFVQSQRRRFAYGPRGPDYKRPGYDAVLQARTGIMSVTGTGADVPIRAGVSILDLRETGFTESKIDELPRGGICGKGVAECKR